MEVITTNVEAGLGRTLAGVRLPDVTKARWQACLGNGRKEAPTHEAPGVSRWAVPRLGISTAGDNRETAYPPRGARMPGERSAGRTTTTAARLAAATRLEKHRSLWAKRSIQPIFPRQSMTASTRATIATAQSKGSTVRHKPCGGISKLSRVPTRPRLLCQRFFIRKPAKRELRKAPRTSQAEVRS